MGSGLSRPNSARRFSFYSKQRQKKPPRTKSVPLHLEALSSVKSSEKINGVLQPSISCGQILPGESHESIDKNVMDKSPENDNTISASELYNVIVEETWNGKIQILDEYFALLIDCRSVVEFEECRIATAIHSSKFEKLDDNEVRKYHLIIMYAANERDINSKTVLKLIGKFLALDKHYFILNEGFEIFKKSYPFLCNNKLFQCEKDRQEFFKLYPSEVLKEKLYQGNAHQALNIDILNALGITHVVNVTSEHPNKFEENDIKYLRIHVDDHPTSDLQSWLKATTKFIDNAIQQIPNIAKKKSKVLVHCNMGRSRSSTVVLAYLMETLKWHLVKACTWLKDCRPTVVPNNGFIVQLLAYEKELFGEQKSDLNDIPF